MKRTKAQEDFDLAKHGWAFCNTAMLASKLEHLGRIARYLAPNDQRHRLLETIKKHLRKEQPS